MTSNVYGVSEVSLKQEAKKLKAGRAKKRVPNKYNVGDFIRLSLKCLKEISVGVSFTKHLTQLTLTCGVTWLKMGGLKASLHLQHVMGDYKVSQASIQLKAPIW